MNNIGSTWRRSARLTSFGFDREIRFGFRGKETICFAECRHRNKKLMEIMKCMKTDFKIVEAHEPRDKFQYRRL